MVPPLALNTALSVADVFASVTNCSPPGVASSCCMNDQTWPADLYPPCDATTSLQLMTVTLVEKSMIVRGSSGPE